MKTYGIKPSYKIRPVVPEFDDTPFKDEYQDEVYKHAADVALFAGARSIVDLGCGSGFKLLKYFSHLHTVGVDRAPTVKFLRNKYITREWFEIGEVFHFFEPSLLICSDVIEHVQDPDALLSTIERLNPTFALFSTPDRVEIALGTEDGPPRNVHHVREWIHDEFVSYLASKFEILQTHRGKTIVVLVKVGRR